MDFIFYICYLLQSQISLMSIYSGFATRFQQQAYDQYLDQLLFVLQKRVLKIYTKQHTDQEKFRQAIMKLHHQLKAMEKHKYLEPKSSTTFEQLVQYLCVIDPNDKSSKEESILKSRFKQPKQKKHHKQRKSLYDVSLRKLKKISSRKRNQSINAISTIKNPHFLLKQFNNKDIQTVQPEQTQKSIINHYQSDQRTLQKQTMWVKVQQTDSQSRKPTSQAKYSSSNTKRPQNFQIKVDEQIKKKRHLKQTRLIRHMFDDYT